MVLVKVWIQGCTFFFIGCVVGIVLINHLNVFHARVAFLSDISIIQCPCFEEGNIYSLGVAILDLSELDSEYSQKKKKKSIN